MAWQFQNVLNVGIQIILLVFTGWCFPRFGLLTAEQFMGQINVLVLRVAFPSLTIYMLGLKVDLRDAEAWRSLGAYVLWVTLVQAGIVAYSWMCNGRNTGDAAVLNLVLTANNTIIVGLPLMQATFPDVGGRLSLLSAFVLFLQVVPFSITSFEVEKWMVEDHERQRAAAAAAAAWSDPPSTPGRELSGRWVDQDGDDSSGDGSRRDGGCTTEVEMAGAAVAAACGGGNGLHRNGGGGDGRQKEALARCSDGGDGSSSASGCVGEGIAAAAAADATGGAGGGGDVNRSRARRSRLGRRRFGGGVVVGAAEGGWAPATPLDSRVASRATSSCTADDGDGGAATAADCRGASGGGLTDQPTLARGVGLAAAAEAALAAATLADPRSEISLSVPPPPLPYLKAAAAGATVAVRTPPPPPPPPPPPLLLDIDGPTFDVAVGGPESPVLYDAFGDEAQWSRGCRTGRSVPNPKLAAQAALGPAPSTTTTMAPPTREAAGLGGCRTQPAPGSTALASLERHASAGPDGGGSSANNGCSGGSSGGDHNNGGRSSSGLRAGGGGGDGGLGPHDVVAAAGQVAAAGEEPSARPFSRELSHPPMEDFGRQGAAEDRHGARKEGSGVPLAPMIGVSTTPQNAELTPAQAPAAAAALFPALPVTVPVSSATLKGPTAKHACSGIGVGGSPTGQGHGGGGTTSRRDTRAASPSRCGGSGSGAGSSVSLHHHHHHHRHYPSCHSQQRRGSCSGDVDGVDATTAAEGCRGGHASAHSAEVPTAAAAITATTTSTAAHRPPAPPSLPTPTSAFSFSTSSAPCSYNRPLPPSGFCPGPNLTVTAATAPPVPVQPAPAATASAAGTGSATAEKGRKADRGVGATTAGAIAVRRRILGGRASGDLRRRSRGGSAATAPAAAAAEGDNACTPVVRPRLTYSGACTTPGGGGAAAVDRSMHRQSLPVHWPPVLELNRLAAGRARQEEDAGRLAPAGRPSQCGSPGPSPPLSRRLLSPLAVACPDLPVPQAIGLARAPTSGLGPAVGPTRATCNGFGPAGPVQQHGVTLVIDTRDVSTRPSGGRGPNAVHAQARADAVRTSDGSGLPHPPPADRALVREAAASMIRRHGGVVTALLQWLKLTLLRYRRTWSIAWVVLKNPLLWSLFVALLVNLSGLRQLLYPASGNYRPELGWVAGTLSWTSGITVPVALFSNGVWLYGKRFRRQTLMQAGWLMLLKLLVLGPLQLACAAACRLKAEEAMSLLLLALCPVASTSFVIASQYGHGTDIVTAVTLLGTVLLVPVALVALAVPRELGLYSYSVHAS